MLENSNKIIAGFFIMAGIYIISIFHVHHTLVNILYYGIKLMIFPYGILISGLLIYKIVKGEKENGNS